MSRASTGLNARLVRLRLALERAKHIEFGTVLSAFPMAKLLRVNWPTLRAWCDEIPELEDSGAVVRGANGMEYEFKPDLTIWVLIKHYEARVSGEAKKSRQITDAVGVEMSAAEVAPSIAETKDLVNLTLTVVAAAERQRRYTEAQRTMEFLSNYNQRVVDGIMGVRTRVDPNGNLPAHVRAAVDSFLRQVATEVHGEAARFIEEQSAGLQQAGTG
jgi:hypothetical protein